MKKLFIGLILIGSFSTFAGSGQEASTCEGTAREEILNSATLRAKLVDLLSDSDFTALAEISDTANAIAKLACKK